MPLSPGRMVLPTGRGLLPPHPALARRDATDFADAESRGGSWSAFHEKTHEAGSWVGGSRYSSRLLIHLVNHRFQMFGIALDGEHDGALFNAVGGSGNRWNDLAAVR